MKLVIQKVKKSVLYSEGKRFSEIKNGMLVLVGITTDDTKQVASKVAQKILKLRIFEDENEKMNLSVSDIQGEILVVSQFTLAGECKKGTRPSFDNAKNPTEANELYEYFIKKLKFYGVPEVGTGVFGGDMQVHIQNDGPVTLILDTDDWK